MIWKIPITILFFAIATGLMYIALSIFIICVIYYTKSEGRDISRKHTIYQIYLADNRETLKT